MYSEELCRERLQRITNQAIQQNDTAWVGPYLRPLHASFAEDRFLGLTLPRTCKEGLMLDVGAHHGSSLSPFSKAGWEIHAFEPDPINRQHLIKRFGKDDKVTINPVAVDETGDEYLPFYTSEESTGISSLNNFRDTHQRSKRCRRSACVITLKRRISNGLISLRSTLRGSISLLLRECLGKG